jgi:8-oxo-dGTP pyrophosphatase MutT (NUDIX family)
LSDQPDAVLQGGAVAVRLKNGEPEFVLVTAKKNPSHWIFPKGHIEPGENARQCAMRELSEEAGIRGVAIASLGNVRFVLGDQPISVDYFLCKYVAQKEIKENRRIQWLPLQEAQAQLSFEDLKEILRDAAGWIARHGLAARDD